MTEAAVHVAAPDDLDVPTLYALLKLRADVFVVEQECAYPDLDGRDLEAGTRHLWIDADADDGPAGYLRILDDGADARIGRVCVAASARGQGGAALLMREALAVIGDRPSVLGAQAHLQHWYERFGYAVDGPGYVEDGIPHVPMRRAAPATS